MIPLRFTLASLMGYVLLLSVQLAAIAAGTQTWSQIVYTLTVFLLLLSSIATRGGNSFWYGFALVGSGYFLIGFGPWFNQICNADPPLAFYHPNDGLFTSVLIYRAAESSVPFLPPGDPQYGNRETIHAHRVAYTAGIAHSILTVALAVCAGLVSSVFGRRSDKGQAINIEAAPRAPDPPKG
ncbi:MAG: hypothetical protein ACP5XB_18110 [Isosphaeraceae bacterium]